MVFSRDGRTLYFRSGSGSSPRRSAERGGGAAAARRRRRRTRRRRGAGGAAAPKRRRTSATARQVTYTANIEVDHKALRAQVFNEGWRIMKNRFYDAKMHGADWNAAWETYGSLLDHVVDREELQTVMMMMIGQLNASHTA
jgi:tricorn protease